MVHLLLQTSLFLKQKEAIGVLVAPANTPTNPKEAKNEGDKFNIPDNVFPNVDPITNKGVTSPPWYPAPKVIDVKISFPRKSKGDTCPSKASDNKGRLKPKYFLLPTK